MDNHRDAALWVIEGLLTQLPEGTIFRLTCTPRALPDGSKPSRYMPLNGAPESANVGAVLGALNETDATRFTLRARSEDTTTWTGKTLRGKPFLYAHLDFESAPYAVFAKFLLGTEKNIEPYWGEATRRALFLYETATNHAA